MIRTGKGKNYFCRNCNTEISYSRVIFRDSLCIGCFKKLIEPLIDNKFLILYDRRGIGGYLSLFSKYNKLPKNQLLKELEKFRVKDYQSGSYQKERIEV
jgi:hypothetical protein